MKIRTVLIALAVAGFVLTGCDAFSSDSPTAPDIARELQVSIRCAVANFVVVECSSTVTGGERPYFYSWAADFQDPRVGEDANTVSFNYQDHCNSRTTPLQAQVTLEVIDAHDDDRDSADQVVEVCGFVL